MGRLKLKKKKRKKLWGTVLFFFFNLFFVYNSVCKKPFWRCCLAMLFGDAEGLDSGTFFRQR